MNTTFAVTGIAALAAAILLGVAYAAPLVLRADQLADLAQGDVAGGAGSVISGNPRPIPASRQNLRMVGPRFYPDPANALDLKG